MNWTDLEQAFLHAWKGTLSRKKWLMGFIALSICGMLVVFCRALAVDSNSWVRQSLLFLPFFFSTGFLSFFGVLAIRIYTQEKRGIAVQLSRTAAGSFGTAIGTSYFSFPPILLYLFLWIVLGLFFLLKEIPVLGPFFNVIFAFAPFLLIFCSLVLSLFSIAALFFIVPAAAHRSIQSIDFLYKTARRIRAKPFMAFFLFLIALLPALVTGGILSLAALMTNLSFSLVQPTAALAMEWFFVMLPFCALLSPAILFFFHFAAESYQLLNHDY